MLRYWNPSDLWEANRSMDRLFDTFFGYGGTSAPASRGQGELPTYSLPVDVVETEDAYVLTAPVPGFKPEQVEVTWHEGLLTIHAQAEPADWKGQWLRQERPYGHLMRRLELPDSIQSSAIEAGFENGLLTVTVPKAPKPEPVRIPVGGAAGKQLKS